MHQQLPPGITPGVIPTMGTQQRKPLDLVTSPKPCALPQDMPLPVRGSRAAAAAEEADDDASGFDWQGLARPSPQQPHPQHNSAEAVAAASHRIAIITGAIAPPAPVPAPAAPSSVNTTKNKPEGPVDGTDALGRRVWDKEYYEAKAKEKAAAAGDDEFLNLLPKPRERPKPPPLPPCGYRAQLKQRTFKLDFEREVGKTKMVTLQTPRMQQGGFWCDVCECLCKDSQSYLDHINGRNHNRILGMSMRVERVPLPRVKAKLQAARRELTADTEGTELVKAEVGSKGTTAAAAATASGANEAEDEFDRVKRRIEELQREQELKKQRKKEKKKKAAAAAGTGGTTAVKSEDTSAANPEAAALAALGFPTSFSGC